MCNLRIVCFSELQHLNVFDKSSESTDSFLIGFNHTQKMVLLPIYYLSFPYAFTE